MGHGKEAIKGTKNNCPKQTQGQGAWHPENQGKAQLKEAGCLTVNQEEGSDQS